MDLADDPTPPRPVPPPFPNWLRRALEPTGVVKQTWQKSLAPASIGLFLWVAFFDQFPREVMVRGGLLPAVVGAGSAGCLCYLLFYLSPALLGAATGRGLMGVSAGAFGTRGAAWVPGLVFSATQVLVIAVSVGYGTALCFRGLVLLGVLDPSALGVVPPGAGFWRDPAFLLTAAAWGLATTLAGGHLARVIIALMIVYPFVPAAILGASTLAAFRGLPEFNAPAVGPEGGGASGPVALVSLAVAVQMILGFFAPSALASTDWGREAVDSSEVRKGGVVTVAFASWIIATLALLTVAGAAGIAGRPPGGPGDPALPSYQDSLVSLFGGRVAGGLFQLLALTALAPACYAGHHLFQWPHDWKPALPRAGWTLVGLGLALPLIATGWAFRLLEVFSLTGALCAPVVGVLSAEYLRGGHRRSAIREGYNLPGLIGWAAGFGLGLVPAVARGIGATGPVLWQPWVLYGYLAAFFVHLTLSAAGFSSAPVEPPLPGEAPTPPPASDGPHPA